MAEFNVELKGQDKAIKDIRAYYEKRKPKIENVILRAGHRVEYEAKLRVPVDTGRLKSSLTTAEDKGRGYFTVKVGTNVNYGKYVEFGTRKMRAQPYLLPAFKLQKNKVVADIKRVFRAP